MTLSFRHRKLRWHSQHIQIGSEWMSPHCVQVTCAPNEFITDYGHLSCAVVRQTIVSISSVKTWQQTNRRRNMSASIILFISHTQREWVLLVHVRLPQTIGCAWELKRCHRRSAKEIILLLPSDVRRSNRKNDSDFVDRNDSDTHHLLRHIVGIKVIDNSEIGKRYIQPWALRIFNGKS